MSSEYEYKLSVVVLVYNTEDLLEECLDSLVNQTLDDIEIICVNDESKDNSLNILKRYQRKYDNIKIIDQKNTGGATAGNNGLKMAKGEYVTLIDSDDIVVEDAYEKLYNKAKETDSDIVSGKPLRYFDKFQRSLGTLHDVWDEEKTLHYKDDMKLYYDVFYWNKIYRRSFIEKYDVYMIPNKLYADVPFVLKAYKYANKITIIPDFVYYWRVRSTNSSISSSLYEIDNMLDRLDYYNVLKDYFKEDTVLFNEIIKIIFERLIFPIKGITEDFKFKEAYLKEMRRILNDREDTYENKYLTIIHQLYMYLIYVDKIDILEEFMKNYEDVKDIFVYNGKSYWNLKYFRNPVIGIPDEIFEIKSLHRNFIDIHELCLKDNSFHINLSIPPTLKIDEVRIRFNGLTKKYDNLEDNSHSFDLNLIEDNRYELDIALERLENINYYDVYLEVVYDGKREVFRLGRNNFVGDIDGELFFEENMGRIVLTEKDNLSFINADVDSLLNMDLDERGFRIISNEKQLNYKLGLAHEKETYDVYFKRLSIENTDRFTSELEMRWKYSLEKNATYRVFAMISKEKYYLKSKSIADYEDAAIDYEGGKIRLFRDEDDYLYLRWEC